MSFPFFLSQQEILYFAVDNANSKIDKPDCKNQLDGKIIVTYQLKTKKKRNLTFLLCETQKVNLEHVKIQFIKL